MTKQREAARREKDMKEKAEIRRHNEEMEKQQKAKDDKLSKKTYTYDYKGSIIFIKKPIPDLLPQDFNVSKIAKKSLKKTPIQLSKLEESVDDIIQKHFGKGIVLRIRL